MCWWIRIVPEWNVNICFPVDTDFLELIRIVPEWNVNEIGDTVNEGDRI